MAFQTLLLDDCNFFITHFLESFSSQRKNVTIFHLCCINFSGCQLNNVSFIKLLLSLSKSCTIGNLHTWLTWLLHNVLFVTCVPTLRTCLFLFAQNLLPLVDHLLFLLQIYGTLFSLLSLGLLDPVFFSTFRLLKTHLYPYHPP